MIWCCDGQKQDEILQFRHDGFGKCDFFVGGYSNSGVIASSFMTCNIVAGEKVEKMWLHVIINRLGDDRTTTVPLNQSHMCTSYQSHECVCAILTAQ